MLPVIRRLQAGSPPELAVQQQQVAARNRLYYLSYDRGPFFFLFYSSELSGDDRLTRAAYFVY